MSAPTSYVVDGGSAFALDDSGTLIEAALDETGDVRDPDGIPALRWEHALPVIAEELSAYGRERALRIGALLEFVRKNEAL